MTCGGAAEVRNIVAASTVGQLHPMVGQLHPTPILGSSGEPTIPPGKDGGLGGGPKTTEPPTEDVKKEDLLTTVDISPELSPGRQGLLEKILLKNELAFGLDGRLGHYLA
ncbi:hypothetical protein M422DRAFT_272913 [Sphaerobolus stellatus SS14]|uniref:Uncharacterized protein n=1 Tax=Sphaerobolus stellatus (strain SS14) TaxID=990650 RepID=A0A0C9ULD4_SPHS4|nr:hypothetical protein M422DRAFT_272913 [Sphaerobolus stellatus SS14]